MGGALAGGNRGFTHGRRAVRGRCAPSPNLREMEEGTRLEALVKIRNLMRAFELTPADLWLVEAPKQRGRPRKVAT